MSFLTFCVLSLLAVLIPTFLFNLHPTLYSPLSYLAAFRIPSSGKIPHYSHQTKRLLTPKELLAYATPSLSALTSHATIGMITKYSVSVTQFTYLIQPCPLQTSQPHLLFSYLSLSFQSFSCLLSSLSCAHCITQYLQVTLTLMTPLQPWPSCHLQGVPNSS